jgi:mono/diheme cytochrome c family protein
VDGARGPLIAEDAARGQLIYETRCIACHDRSVHARNPRSARSCEEIRDQVERWSLQSGSGWSREEIEDVTAYLNQRYYHFPVRDGRCIRSVAGTGSADPAR